MAHTCPDCGQTCYCNGDIDDCLFDDDDCEDCDHFNQCSSDLDDLDDFYDDDGAFIA